MPTIRQMALVVAIGLAQFYSRHSIDEICVKSGPCLFLVSFFVSVYLLANRSVEPANVVVVVTSVPTRFLSEPKIKGRGFRMYLS
jgi:hypothetical protein